MMPATTAAEATHYSVFYCEKHGQGTVIIGSAARRTFDACGCEPPDRCDVKLHGVVTVARDGRVDASKSHVREKDYRRFADGWRTSYFAREVYDADGTPAACPESLAAYFQNAERETNI